MKIILIDVPVEYCESAVKKAWELQNVKFGMNTVATRTYEMEWTPTRKGNIKVRFYPKEPSE